MSLSLIICILITFFAGIVIGKLTEAGDNGCEEIIIPNRLGNYLVVEGKGCWMVMRLTDGGVMGSWPFEETALKEMRMMHDDEQEMARIEKELEDEDFA